MALKDGGVGVLVLELGERSGAGWWVAEAWRECLGDMSR